MTLRTLNRTGQVASDRQQRVIYNAATPALDRAKAKLEFMFDSQRDTRYPNGIPEQTFLHGMMLNDGNTGGVIQLDFKDANGHWIDAYTFPDEAGAYDTDAAETRIDIDQDDASDNAWSYRVDLDEDGTLDATVAYSILFENPPSGDPTTRLSNASDTAMAARADALQVRHGPLSIPVQDDECSSSGTEGSEEGTGWTKPESGGATVYKNFQVDVLVVPDDAAATVSTLEFHQDRKINEGNKWGAWFRNDLEVAPGPEFNWNGAMHSEGNFVVGENNRFTGYLISSPASCYYSREASEITVADRTVATQGSNFEGQIISSQTRFNRWDSYDKSIFHLHKANGPLTQADKPTLTKDNDSTNSGGRAPKPADYLLDPVILLTQNVSKARNFRQDNAEEDGNPASQRDDSDWGAENSPFVQEGRIYNKSEDAPSVDDSFRADNRYGPKPQVNDVAIPGKIGLPITNNLMEGSGVLDEDLIRLDPPPGAENNDFSNVGLDGYWERRARAEGARVLVGQRLELGNAFGWGGGVADDGDYVDTLDDEPLMPWNGCSENSNNSRRCGEARQRRALRDNLAAVQATAVYHANATGVDKDFPVACLASTVHPGTPYTLQDSATFLNWTKDLEQFWSMSDRPDLFISDFFRGEGTNGWEYNAPSNRSAATFSRDISSSQPLGQALRNLGHFAGDRFGGAPSFTPIQDNLVHPYPLLSMWGDFSMLRRVLDELDDGVSYDDLSPADKTTLQTAACTLGMLANELHNLETFTYTTTAQRDTRGSGSAQASYLDILNARLIALQLDDPSDTDIKAALGLDAGDPLPSYWEEPPLDSDNSGDYEDFYRDTTTLEERFDGLGNADPEAYIARLKQWREADALAIQANRKSYFSVDDDLINLAKLIMLREQTIRDRSWGFNSGTQTYSPNCMPVNENPIHSAFKGSTAYGPVSDAIRDRTGLQALCTTQAKFGALYSVFPGERPLSQAAATDGRINTADNHGETLRSRPGSDAERELIRTTFNPGFSYRAIAANDLQAIALTPKLPSSWTLPHGGLGNGATQAYDKANPNSNNTLLITCNLESLCDDSTATGGTGTLPPTPSVPTTYRTRTMQVAFKDSGLYNGREMLNVRAMDLDLELLRQSNLRLGSDAAGNGDRWLPNSGIIYAFREDAVREDAITRPRRAEFSACDSDGAYQGDSTCHMSSFNEAATASTDPPLAENNAISPKPVDYAPDPDRRPFGFRLRNGTQLSRPNDNGRGLSLISDNSLYIQGSFNRHQDSAGKDLEEFSDYRLYTETGADFSRFYDRKRRDPRFATVAGDAWRPSELLADSVSILSANFCDGSLFDSFHSANRSATRIEVSESDSNSDRQIKAVQGTRIRTVNAPWRSLYNCPPADGEDPQTSYTDGFFPQVTLTGRTHRLNQSSSLSGYEEYWHHENPYDTRSPYAITRQGNPRTPTQASAYSGSYFRRGDNMDYRRQRLMKASNTSVNAIIISGIVPSRPKQSYGGLHNFPRFLEEWKQSNTTREGNLRISGSLVQLNFSHTATGAFDQDAWEPGEESTDRPLIAYYFPPRRLWGYDVGLQKGVAGPLASRFVTRAERSRSEFYSEPPADDPYIYNLCQAIKEADQCPN